MTRTTRAVTAAAVALGAAASLAAAPASATRYEAGCVFAVLSDPTDPAGASWAALTVSYFVGSPNVTGFTVTCWLQSSPDHGVNELLGTRHTCADAVAVGQCVGPAFFQTTADDLYQCVHLRWTETPSPVPPGAVVDHEHLVGVVTTFLSDVFSTGGVTTMGGTSNIIATVQLAVTDLVATLGETAPTPGGPTTTYTETLDADPVAPGAQCRRL